MPLNGVIILCSAGGIKVCAGAMVKNFAIYEMLYNVYCAATTTTKTMYENRIACVV